LAIAYFQATTEGLSVPHLMCWRTEGTSTTTRHCCGVLVILAPDTKLQTSLLITYLLTSNQQVGRLLKQVVTRENDKINK